MGRVLVRAADVREGRIARLSVDIPNLPTRVLDRDTAVRWMRDGHSFLPVVGGEVRRALQLVEVDDGWFVRDDHQAVAADLLPELPPIA